jgi:DNA-binding CsgD family transcriptional regulator
MSVAPSSTHITPREKEILHWIAEGKTADEVSVILGISHITVNTHKQSMMRKAGVYKDTALVAWGFRQYVID